jgi:hypothetical protein
MQFVQLMQLGQFMQLGSCEVRWFQIMTNLVASGED